MDAVDRIEPFGVEPRRGIDPEVRSFRRIFANDCYATTSSRERPGKIIPVAPMVILAVRQR